MESSTTSLRAYFSSLTFSLVSSLFSISLFYVVFVTQTIGLPTTFTEIPINYTLSKAKRPSFFLGAMIVAWGIVMTLMGIVQNFAGLVAARVVLGITE